MPVVLRLEAIIASNHSVCKEPYAQHQVIGVVLGHAAPTVHRKKCSPWRKLVRRLETNKDLDYMKRL